MLMMNLPRIMSRCCATYVFLVLSRNNQEGAAPSKSGKGIKEWGLAVWAPLPFLVGRLGVLLPPSSPYLARGCAPSLAWVLFCLS